MQRIYLDNAATTPLRKEVIAAMCDVMDHAYGNPSSIHADGRLVRTKIEECRRSIAKLMHCTPGEIFFTSGGTEADNMAIRMVVNSLGVKHIITSAIEHHAVLHTVESLVHQGLAEVHWVGLLPNGQVDLESLESLLAMYPGSLVSLMHANNELGNVLDIQQAGALCRQYKSWFHTDAVQTVGHLPIDLSSGMISFLSAGAHKFNGPKGSGFIYINAGNSIHPMITGGSQERNMRAGTENVYGIVGMTKALELACEEMSTVAPQIASLRQHMKDALIRTIPDITFNGDADGACLYTILSASFPPSSINEMLLFKLDIEGVAASGGSACTSGSNAGSHVLSALGCDPERATVRFSFGKQNTIDEIEQVVGKLSLMYQKEVVK